MYWLIILTKYGNYITNFYRIIYAINKGVYMTLFR